MITRKYETIVGIFVVASLAALLIMVVIVARQEGIFQEYVEYRAIFKNVSGLKVRSEVHLAGVTVGSVLRTTINSEGNIVVTFQVLKQYADRIRKDSKATIGYMGLLGDKSLDLSPGSPQSPRVDPGGLVASVEPLDFTQLLARAAPSLEDVQKILNNLVSVTEGMAEPNSEFGQIITYLKEIVQKINEGKGSLGKLVNDDVLYRDTADTMAQIRKVMDEVGKSKGLAGALLNDPVLKEQTLKTMEGLQVAVTDLNQTLAHLKVAAARLPDMAKKLDSFLVDLKRAGVALPGLVTQGEAAFSDFDATTKAMQRTWLLRRYVPTPKEHTIRLDGPPGKE
jgi:phospholipid/cholesterol/gamma-HCH transport system substrate-binding protein